MTDAFLYAAARTPFGRFGGALAGVRPDDLAATALTGVLDRAPDLDRAEIGDVQWGLANGAGEDNRNVARMAVLLAGLPVSVPGATVNRLCGSSLEALGNAARCVESGDAEVVVAGGVESMTRAPWVLPKPARGFPAGNVEAVSTTLGWRLVNERMPAEWTTSLGECNELLADRSASGESARTSSRRARTSSPTPPGSRLLRRPRGAGRGGGPGPRRGDPAGSTAEALAGLKPSFRRDGTITAGNASPLNDGAAALLVGSEAASSRIGLAPLARVAGRGVHAVDPQMFGVAPVEAAGKALARAGIGWADVAAVELNEAFAVQSLACVDAWVDAGLRDPEIVNARGGAIAIGHPLGASGARVVGTLAHRLREGGDRWGLAAICIGVGQALAVVLENVSG